MTMKPRRNMPASDGLVSLVRLDRQFLGDQVEQGGDAEGQHPGSYGRAGIADWQRAYGWGTGPVVRSASRIVTSCP